MRRTASFLFLFLLIPAATQAQPKDVSRAESKLILDMPGLENQRARYQFSGWNSQYTIETSYAAQTPHSGDYPRAQVYLRLLAPGRVWTVSHDIDAKFIQNFAPFFKEKAVKMVTSGGGGRTDKQRLHRFEMDGADCAFFAVTEAYAVGGSMATVRSGGGSLTSSVNGIYCGARGSKLTDEDIAKVFAGYKINQNPGQ
jgi:hypothetical protein